VIAALAFVLCLAANAPPAAPGQLPAPYDVAAPPAGALKTPSGVAIEILRRGRGRQHPRANDCVKLHFSAWKRDGTFLSDTRRWRDPQSQCLVTAFPGVAEALKKMVPGELCRVWVPARLTFRPDDDDAPPSVDVTLDIELYEIVAAPPTPSDLKAPPAGARRTSSGLVIETLKKGKGSQHPQDANQVKLDFSGWSADGRLIESSVMAHHPAIFPMTGVMRGWREALLQMGVGDKVRLWIPRDLAFGAQAARGQPKGDLVYELELLEIQ
jgi:peptidylprolyl isomerase